MDSELTGRHITCLAMAIALSMAAGCASNPARTAQVNSRQRDRQQDINWAVSDLVQREQQCPKNLEIAARYISDDLKRSSVNFQRDLRFAGQWWQSDLNRFIQRQPEYRSEILRQLRGKPENIPAVAVDMFY
jgi:hypothetical protein